MGRKFDTTEITNPRATIARRMDEAEGSASDSRAEEKAEPAAGAMPQSKFSGYDQADARRSRTPPQHMLLRRDRNP